MKPYSSVKIVKGESHETIHLLPPYRDRTTCNRPITKMRERVMDSWSKAHECKTCFAKKNRQQGGRLWK